VSMAAAKAVKSTCSSRSCSTSSNLSSLVSRSSPANRLSLIMVNKYLYFIAMRYFYRDWALSGGFSRCLLIAKSLSYKLERRY
jgi:hypothetical protein